MIVVIPVRDGSLFDLYWKLTQSLTMPFGI